ncbi:MAG: DoxX family protein [Bacteroidota bacterium]
MLTLETIVKVIIALSILFVWVLRFDNIVKEFKQYELSDLVRTIVGTSKIILATLLVVSIWHKEFVFIPASLMAFLMISAQYFHFKVKNPWQKHVPSLFLFALCIYLIYQNT